MLEQTIYFSSFIIITFLIILFHELGHYIIGRLSGIAKENIKILFSFPPDTALKNWDGDWLTSSNMDEYLKVYSKFDPRHDFLYYFLSGGLFLETVFVVIISILIFLSPIPNLYLLLLAFLSIFINLVYVLIDMINTIRKNEPAGDISTMWLFSPKLTALIFFLFFTLRFAIIMIDVYLL